MKVVYSCVMDNKPKYIFQAFCLIWSLLDMAGVPASSIVVHAIEGCRQNVLNRLCKLGVQVKTIQSFSQNYPHCNKIGQLSSLRTMNADVVILLDTDMVVTQMINTKVISSTIKARIVGGPNPPLKRLEHLFLEAGFGEFPDLCKTAFTEHMTYHVNVNGGLYILPYRLLEEIDVEWRKRIGWIFDHPHLVDKSHHFCVDQMSFGMAVHSLGLHVEHLPVEMNYPTQRRGLIPEKPPIVLHYHDHVHKSGQLRLADNPLVNKVIEESNHVIAQRLRCEYEHCLSL